MNHMLKAIFLLLSVSIAALPVQAAEPAARLAGILAAARSMEATFVQRVDGSNGMLAQSASGTMSVARPHLFRWAVSEPFEQLVVADSEQVWVYDPDLAQAVVRPMNKQLADTPALLFSGDAQQIGKQFTVKLLEEKGDRVHFSLAPISETAMFERLEVGFLKNRLHTMVLVDGLGQKTTITFSDVVLNGPIAVDAFRFTPPPGTDVVRDGG